MAIRARTTPGSGLVFFANPRPLRALCNRFLKGYGSNSEQLREIGLWLPALSTREDAYSLAILLIEALGEDARFRVCFPGPATTAIYGEPDLKGLSAARRRRFFVPVDGGFRPGPLLTERCVPQAGAGPYQSLESLHDAIAVLDPQLRIQFVNRAFCELFRVNASVLIGKPLLGAGPGQWRPRARPAALRKLLLPGTPGGSMEVEVTAAGAGNLLLDIRASDWNCGPARLIAVRNETAIGKVREELQRLRLTVDALLESATQSIIGVLPNGTIVLANGNTREMFGYAKEELLGRPLTLLIPEGARRRHNRYHKEYFEKMDLRTMGMRSNNLEALRKDGTTFPVEIGLSAVPSAEGKLAIAFIQDVSERRAMEQAIRARGAEVQSLAASLLTAKEEIERRVSRELHDQICQPLASLAIDLGALASDREWPGSALDRMKTLQARAVKVSEEARHMAYELHPSVLDDLGLVTSMRALCKEYSRKLGLTVAFQSGKMPPEIPREIASCLYRITQESLQNVLKHAGATEVSVSLSRRKRTVIVIIADNGAGFAASAVKARGGLGLIGMEERARLVAGRITVDSSPGRGTTVTLEVPLERPSSAP